MTPVVNLNDMHVRGCDYLVFTLENTSILSSDFCS